jgi:hypothetical protein
LIKVTNISLTSGNLAAGDLVQWALARDGAESDTIAASVYVLGVYFEYADA